MSLVTTVVRGSASGASKSNRRSRASAIALPLQHRLNRSRASCKSTFLAPISLQDQVVGMTLTFSSARRATLKASRAETQTFRLAHNSPCGVCFLRPFSFPKTCSTGRRTPSRREFRGFYTLYCFYEYTLFVCLLFVMQTVNVKSVVITSRTWSNSHIARI